MAQESINIKGMHCNNCVQKIEDKLKSLEGVENVKVSLIENKAEVTFNKDILTLDKIKSEIAALGYDAGSVNSKPKMDGAIKQGILYGLLPHAGCIAFIAASVIGATFFMDLIKPLLMSRYFFYLLVGISLLFATISSVLYLKHNKIFSFEGAKRKWKYLSLMYGSTITINLLFFLFIFPIAANFTVASPNSLSATSFSTSNIQDPADPALGQERILSIRLSVDIPCTGHAPLISSELKKLKGIKSVKFISPNFFDVSYDSLIISKSQIVALEVFKEYPVKVLGESSPSAASLSASATTSTVSCGCSLGQ